MSAREMREEQHGLCEIINLVAYFEVDNNAEYEVATSQRTLRRGFPEAQGGSCCRNHGPAATATAGCMSAAGASAENLLLFRLCQFRSAAAVGAGTPVQTGAST